VAHRPLPFLAIVLAILAIGSSATAGVTLTYRMSKAESLKYNCGTTGNGVITAMGRTGPVQMEATFVYVMTCTGVDEAGNMTIVNQVRDLQAKASWDGQPLPVGLAIPQITTVISPNGTVLRTQVLRSSAGAPGGAQDPMAALGSGIAGTGLLDVGQFFGELRNPGFPKEPVVPGNRWKQSLQLKTQTGQPMVVGYETTLLDYATLNQRECARLQTKYEMPLDLGLTGASLFNLTGKQSGSQIAYFDYNAGRPIRFDGTSDTEMVMETPQLFGASGGRQIAVTMVMRSNTSVVLQP